jgi:hypothetical protein
MNPKNPPEKTTKFFMFFIIKLGDFYVCFRCLYWRPGEGEDGPTEGEVWPHHCEAGGSQTSQGNGVNEA